MAIHWGSYGQYLPGLNPFLDTGNLPMTYLLIGWKFAKLND